MSEILSLQGYEPSNNQIKRSQVYMATHNGAGERLPLMNRSFISFSYGGKPIEDFGLIAITDGDAIQRDLYGKFNNNVSNYESVDGQFYWGSHFENGSLSLRLATDGITEKQLNDFKNYFKPGPAKELILAENPNRGIQARIDETPQYEMWVYEGKVSRKINNIVREIPTTLYKGFIELKFIMDDPFWYSIKNVLEDDVLVNTDMDWFKVMAEDEVPCKSMLQNDMFVGNGYYLFSSDAITQSGTTLTAALNDARYLYYAGTATGKPILSFAIHPVIDSSEAYVVDITYNDEMSLIWAGDDETGSGARIKDGNDYGAYIYLARAADQDQSESSDTFYISEPRNKFLYDTNPYNTITIKDNDDNILNVFKFTLPSLYTGYNQAIEIFDTYGKTVDSLIELKTKIKEGVKETYSRAWATAIINYLMVVKNSDVIEDINNQVPSSAMKKMMQYFLVDSEGSLPYAHFSFNSKTGESIGVFTIRQYPTVVIDTTNINENTDLIEFFTNMTKNNIITITENVGDMVYDKYLIIDNRNYFNENGTVKSSDCQKIVTDYQNGLSEFKLEYKNLYL